MVSRKIATRCTICHHPDRLGIERARIAGASLDRIAERFDVKRDAIRRHMMAHVSDAERAEMIADIPISEMAMRAAEEGGSILDHYGVLKSVLFRQLMTASSVNDYGVVASLSRSANDVLEKLGRLTGEMLGAATSVTNNTTIIMSSPVFVKLEAMLVERLAPFPEALGAVLSGLEALEGAHPPDGGANG